MQGGLQATRHRLRLQLRATHCKAPSGRTYWSDSGLRSLSCSKFTAGTACSTQTRLVLHALG